MKAIVVASPHDLRIEEVPQPQIERDDEVLIRVMVGGICGSDIHIYEGTNPLATYPRIIGHEFGGEVAQVGAGVKNVQPGQKVTVDPVVSCGHCYACRIGRPNICETLEVIGVHRTGGFAEYIKVNEKNVYPMAEKLLTDDALLALMEPYSIGAHATARAGILKGDVVLIMGAGPIGLCVMQFAKLRGARTIITDRLPERLTRAGEMGADLTVNVMAQSLTDEIARFTNGQGINVAIDSVCTAGSFEQAIMLSGQGGRVVTLGLINDPTPVAQGFIVKRELAILGSRLNNQRFPEVLDALATDAITPLGLVSQRMHYTKIKDAIELIQKQPQNTCKIILTF